MPQLTFPFDLNGLYVDVLVSCGSSRMRTLVDQNATIPPAIWTKGMIDTGTNVSAVSLALLRRLDIPEGESTTSEGIVGGFATHYYEVSITIADKSALTGPTYAPGDVSVIHMDAPSVEVLIGLDVLMGCRLVIDGRVRLFTFEF